MSPNAQEAPMTMPDGTHEILRELARDAQAIKLWRSTTCATCGRVIIEGENGYGEGARETPNGTECGDCVAAEEARVLAHLGI